MENLKKKLSYALYIVLAFVFTSCDENIKYPVYSLEIIKHVPDTLKTQQRIWVIEIIRAASQHMTGGDYEDVDETIEQAKLTSDKLFQVSVIGLRKEIDDNYWNDLLLKPNELNDYEKKLLDSLIYKH